jgi:hypothetical protein
MGRGILKAQLRDFGGIGERADGEIQLRRRENMTINTTMRTLSRTAAASDFIPLFFSTLQC